ncbi:hemocytin-like [Limulus polyphemus]|uniref:Hemocytin-like n=1 Tax=Limulus polyphemus TaxID=6850 RepID=A0ABM1T9Q8_LIMPO|nr:hemocytin-like [Limulus polyphemus]
MNSPYQVGGDYELLEDYRLSQIYTEFCGTDNITKIECRVVGSLKSIKAARQYATCNLPKGLVCNDREQTSGMCQDYEIRVYCQCKKEPTILSTITPFITTEATTLIELPSKCTAPGWTFWMNSNKPDEIGDDESIGELRKKYVFCPENEVEKVECRVASTKVSFEFSKDQNVQCSREGLICKNSGRGDFSTCADYEVRFYCKCADTACDFPRGMEKDYISDQEVSVSSFRSPSTLGNKARLNGNSAWSAGYLSTDEWIQVDLQELQDVTGVITQGNPLQPEWVTAYKVFYSKDSVAFSVLKSPDGSEKVFTGNSDQNTPITNKFDKPLKVRFVRIVPFQWKGWISLRLEILGCNREIPVVTTTMPSCVPGWTQYFNIDSPKSGDGDIELFKDIRNKYDLCDDSLIQKIECRSFVNGQMVDHTETGDVGIKCSIRKGLVCLNWLQKKGKSCHDYSIRVYCGCGPIQTETESITPTVTTPVIIPKCTPGWTKFYNIDVPYTGDGDFESVKELVKKYQFCSADQVKGIKCKASLKSPLKGKQFVDWKETGDNGVECSTTKGLICYNNQQGKGGKCHDYSVQLYCDCVLEPRHAPLCNWTEWWNKDDQDGEGDFEPIKMYQSMYRVCQKPELKAIECRLAKTKHDYREVKQNVTCDIDTGFSCYNKYQIGKCYDYEVRFFCYSDKCPKTVPRPKPIPSCVPSWTPFFNNDSPTSGEGDLELLEDIQKRGNVCFDKYIAGIECKTRIGKTVVDYTESGDFGVKCSPTVGLVCQNSLQKKGHKCQDYSVRFYCSCVPPVPPVTTAPPCPLTQVYDDCGYRCNQTCQSFFKLLVNEQKCALGTPSDLCIPGCRPTVTCSAPYVWRDYTTCVRKEECTCVLPDGTILSPGRVIAYNCQKCQCQDNHLTCEPIPNCGITPITKVITPPTPTAVGQIRCWTDWINIDSPLSGSGDMEDLSEIRLKHSLCSNPLAIECRVASSKESSADAGQNVECGVKTGLHCWNNVNGQEGCYDYEVRFLCPCPGSTFSAPFITTTPPQTPAPCVSGWTNWISSHVVDDKGDYETLQNIEAKHFKLPCESKMITAIECRPIGISPNLPKQNIVCEIKLGLICQNKQGKGGQKCYDYEVRFLCECEGTTTSTELITETPVVTPSITTVVIVPTTPSVLPACTIYKRLISGPTPLPDEKLKASSSLSSESEPQNSRLTSQKGPNSAGAWIPAYLDKDQYLQVDLGKVQPVYGLIIKGQDKARAWVTAFMVMYSSNDQSFSFVTESSNYKVAKVFTGNYDSSSEVEHIFVNPFEARYIRVQPLEWVGQIALRLELLGCEGFQKISTVAPTPSPECQDKMGLENGKMTPDQVRVTSSKGPSFGPSRIGLNTLATKGAAGGWVAKFEDSNQFIEINLRAPKNLTGLITQGRNGVSQWVTSYYITYKSTKDGPFTYLSENNKPKIYPANFDSDTQVTNYFPKIIRAQYLQIHPFKWHNWISMRLELLGCYEPTTEVVSELPVTSTTPFIISKCNEPMGLENGQIPTADIRVSSSLNPQSGSDRIRLNTVSRADGTGGWVAQVNDQKQFVEIRFPDIRELSGIITQGREDADNWVTNFAVLYTADDKKWISARNNVGNKVFKGNTDRNSLVYNVFDTSINAITVRIVPLEFYGAISMRLELLGCFVAYEKCVRYGPWISLSTPKPGSIGDQEPIRKVVEVSGGCLNPVSIQCRESITRKDYSTMQQKVTCDLSRGLLCRNQDQPQNYCYNYEVRIGCWICPNVTTTAIPSVPLCPEISSIISTGCPSYCPPGKLCDGIACVDLIDCPCMQENKRFKPGDVLETGDCQTCFCHMKGHSRCEPKKCPKCPEGEKQKLTSTCKCTCEGCPEGKVLCPTNGQCIYTNNWCDGAIDCPDDEVNCETTPIPTEKLIITTTLPPVIITPTTNPCVTDVPYGVAVCAVQNEYISTFDKLDYKYAVCEHTLMRERARHWYSVSVFKKCTDTKPQYCDKEVKVMIDGLEFSLGPTINDFKIDNTAFHPDNFWIISEKLKDIRIQRAGQELILKSINYGFDVIIDSQQNIKIKASNCLFDKVSGLCGNFNNNKRDDKETPKQEQVLSTEHFGDSWSIGTPGKCLPPVCPSETMKLALQICEHVTKPPFEVCASNMVINTYITLCLSTVCDCLQRPNADPEECKCSAIENFVQTCRSVTKASIGEWRIAHGCAPKCPPGLVWQDCGSPCEMNCDNFQRKDLVCPAVCVSGCFCPPGLLRHGKFCVKPEMCLDCVCKGYGDPNYYTFDGQYYPFQGNCTYVLAQHRTNKGYRDFQIFGTNVECPEEPKTACLSAITVRFKGNTVRVQKGRQVTFNGYSIKESDYPFVAEGFNITAVKDRSAVVQVPSINLAVRYFELNFGFNIELPSKYYFNSTEGLCGICNFDASDDMYHSDGYVTDNVEDFAYSWLTNGTKETCTISKEKIPTPPPEICNFTSTACDFIIDPMPFRKACENDVSYSMKPGRSVCRAKLEYAQQCCKRGISLQKWLELNNCGFDCPSNMVFECRSPCVKTCDNYKTLSSQYCTLEPHFSCFCSKDKVLKQGECLDSVVCETCDAEGHVVGEEWSKGPCEKCSCTEDLKVKCTETLCPPSPVCKINETLRIIPPKNGSCCQTYICEMEVKKCEEINLPDCKLGEVAKIDTSKECPVYVCECDEKMCPPLEWPAKLELGQGTEVHTSGCCKEVVVKCYLDKCPSVPDCPKGFEIQFNKGVCCNESTCGKMCIISKNHNMNKGLNILLDRITGHLTIQVYFQIYLFDKEKY